MLLCANDGRRECCGVPGALASRDTNPGSYTDAEPHRDAVSVPSNVAPPATATDRIVPGGNAKGKGLAALSGTSSDCDCDCDMDTDVAGRSTGGL
jgi:hypothetical protein